MSYFSIELVRDGQRSVMGTSPTYADLENWMNKAYQFNLLPDPPQYTDEIQVIEINEDQSRALKWVWRLTWHEFEAKPEQQKELVQ